MSNPVTVYIRHQRYRIVAEESQEYIESCAELVTQELDAATAGTTLSLTDGAILAGLNLADKFNKERQVSDNLRAQLKAALDENSRLARELTETRREAKKAAKAKKAEAKAEPKQDAE
jgi:cell division protein ZapA (FtsZ GTPase activity inhibitor)